MEMKTTKKKNIEPAIISFEVNTIFDDYDKKEKNKAAPLTDFLLSDFNYDGDFALGPGANSSPFDD